MEEWFMQQVVTEATRGNNCLDLFFTNEEDSLVQCSVVKESLGFSDHAMIMIEQQQEVTDLEVQALPEKAGLQKFNFHKCSEGTWAKLEQELFSIDWTVLPQDLREKIQAIYNLVYEACERAGVPVKKLRNLRKRIGTALYRKRRRLLDQLSRARDQNELQRIRSLISEIEVQLKKAYEEAVIMGEVQAISNIENNPKFFFTYIQSYYVTQSKIGCLENEQGLMVDDEVDKAELIQKQYDSVYTTPQQDAIIEDISAFFGDDADLSDVEFSEEDIVKAANTLKSNSSSGPDGFPALLLKKMSTSLAKPLSVVLRQSLDEGKIPEVLKKGTISPIYKGSGDKRKPKSYRPVTLTSTVSRVFEKVLKARIVDFLESGEKINEGQHGFRRGRSCLSQLLHHYDQVISDAENGQNVDVVYTDFAKCFDKVDHHILLRKVKEVGIGGKIGRWLAAFLLGRVCQVRVGQTLSGPSKVISGIPQGTCLGPILLLIMNHDIEKSVRFCKIGSFADDTKLQKNVTSIEDVQKMNSDLQGLFNWAEVNNMEFNADKFVLLRYGKARPETDGVTYNLPGGQQLAPSTSTRDLGITMSAQGDFEEHIQNLEKGCRKIMAMIFRSFRCRDPKTMLVLHKALILSKLDYCSILWSPQKLCLMRKLEKIQADFTRKLNGARDEQGCRQDYWERLRLLKLFSIERRHERYSIIYIWKILHGLVHNPGVSFYTSGRRGTLCHIPKHGGKLRENSFVIRGPQLFNVMPQAIRDYTVQTEDPSNAVDCFKRALDKILHKIPDRPNLRSDYSKHMPYCNVNGQKSNSLVDLAKYI